MRRISLYIDGQLADFGEEDLVVWNFAQEDLDNPTIVKNSWTNTIKLPGTATNNRIFDEAFRLDRRNAAGRFNPRLRTPFSIFDANGTRLQMGYCKLNSIEGGVYDVTLYGGLGELLYSLAYDFNGDPLTLYNLDYLQTGNPDTELDFTLSRANLLSAWQDLEQPGQATIFAVVNFAPAYNGIPDKFGADKCLFDLDAYEYGAAGQAVANLTRKYTEREMADYRCYLQRPVINVQATLQAIARFAVNQGFSLDITNWDYQGNKFCEGVWMTLPMLKDKRSGDLVTKTDLLGGTMSPADFLLGIVKTFGLKLVCEGSDVTIVERRDFFQNATDDLTPRVDLSTPPAIVPLIMDSKWCEFASEDGGEFATKYKDAYGRTYGSQRIDTGYDFDSSVKEFAAGIPFRGCAQSREFSRSFRRVTASVHRSGDPSYTRVIPAAFLDGGTYALPDGLGGQEGKPLNSGYFTFAWWDAVDNGYDEVGLPQLHAADNKALDGANVLLFYTGQKAVTGAVVSDDVADMGEEPCWNYSSVGTTALVDLPIFSRFLLDGNGKIETALDWGPARELNIPGLQYSSTFKGVYATFWAAYLADRYDQDSKLLRVRVNLAGLRVGTRLLRPFWWYGGALWVINKITNYSLTTPDPAECELVQVRDITNYTTH